MCKKLMEKPATKENLKHKTFHFTSISLWKYKNLTYSCSVHDKTKQKNKKKTNAKQCNQIKLMWEGG